MTSKCKIIKFPGNPKVSQIQKIRNLSPQEQIKGIHNIGEFNEFINEYFFGSVSTYELETLNYFERCFISMIYPLFLVFRLQEEIYGAYYIEMDMQKPSINFILKEEEPING